MRREVIEKILGSDKLEECYLRQDYFLYYMKFQCLEVSESAQKGLQAELCWMQSACPPPQVHMLKS